jgi:hypothetical protein
MESLARPDVGVDVATDLYLDLLKKCLTASIYDESAWRVVERDRLA